MVILVPGLESESESGFKRSVSELKVIELVKNFTQLGGVLLLNLGWGHFT